MKCSNCGHGNVEGSKYCNQCAYPLLGGKISLGAYERLPETKKNDLVFHEQDKKVEDSADASHGHRVGRKNMNIYDPEGEPIKHKRPMVLKMTLVILLMLFVFVGYNGIKFAVDTQQNRVAQAEIKKQQQVVAEELKQLENYREKFNAVIRSYEEQGMLIEENINALTTLRLNRFAQGLGLGDTFNKLVNRALDVSKVRTLKDNSSTLNVLVEELMNPPETYVRKYETLGLLKQVENNITKIVSGDIGGETKEELKSLHEDYENLLIDLRR